MKSRLSMTIGSILLTFSVLPSASAETLQEIFQHASQNDHAFQAAKATLNAGEQNTSLGRAALLPQINASASWEKQDGASDGVELNSDSGLQEPYSRDAEQTTTVVSVGLTQNLFNLSAWHKYNQSKALTSAAQAEYVKAEQDLILRAANGYFNALKAVEYLSTAKAEEQALSHQLEQTKQRFEVGLTAITEVHEAQAVYDSSTANRLVAQGNLGIAFEALEVITGKSYTSLAPLKESFNAAPPTPVERKPWENLALSNNILLKLSELSNDSAQLQAKIAKSEHLPTLTGSIRYTDSQTENGIIDGLESNTDGTTISLNLSVPLYSGGAVSASRRKAVFEAVAQRENLLQTQRDVVQAARSSHLNVITSAATVKARQQAITSNRSALEATKAGYDVGTRDLVDVLNAQRNLYVAQRNYFDALYSYIINTLELKQAAGVLQEQDIIELDAHLDRSRSASYHR